jgi:VCBS repeat protein
VTVLRRRRAHCAPTITTLVFAIQAFFAVIAFATAAGAATVQLVGVDRVRFAWQAGSGSPTGYIVSLSRNDGAFTTYSVVSVPSVEVLGAPDDKLTIKVAATGRNSSGAIVVGPQSSASDRVWLVPAAKYPVAGSWLMHCATCPSLARRALSDASVVTPPMTALPAPWRVIGLGHLRSTGEQIVWHNPTTGGFAIWDAKLLVPIANGSGSGSKYYRGVGAADLDRDGIDEFIVQRTDTGTVTIWSMTSTGFVKRVDIPTLAGATLAAARDFNGDGWVDLLWRNPVSGTLDVWLIGKNLLLALPLSTLLPQVFRLASGLTSDAVVASTGDYDADGWPDVLWRNGDGRLSITYLVNGRTMRYAALPFVAGDLTRTVIDSLDLDRVPGDEIVLQEDATRLITVLNPVAGSTRTPVVHPGRDWSLVGIGAL